MNNIMIKICGITELSTARFLIKNHISLMGLIFYLKSPRYIAQEKAMKLLKNLKKERKKIKVVGVFVNEDINTVQSTYHDLELDYVQLHGSETPEYINSLQIPVIKALKINDDFNEKEILKYQNKNIKYFLLDTFQKGKMGGTGKTFNWKKFQYLKKYPDIIISGGLNINNISQAINFFQPAGVDINSGVEIKPGIKSKKKIKKILKVTISC